MLLVPTQFDVDTGPSQRPFHHWSKLKVEENISKMLSIPKFYVKMECVAFTVWMILQFRFVAFVAVR